MCVCIKIIIIIILFLLVGLLYSLEWARTYLLLQNNLILQILLDKTK